MKIFEDVIIKRVRVCGIKIIHALPNAFNKLTINAIENFKLIINAAGKINSTAEHKRAKIYIKFNTNLPTMTLILRNNKLNDNNASNAGKQKSNHNFFNHTILQQLVGFHTYTYSEWKKSIPLFYLKFIAILHTDCTSTV